MERALHPELAKRIVNVNPQNGRHSHVARWNGRWVIVNVLWELRPR